MPIWCAGSIACDIESALCCCWASPHLVVSQLVSYCGVTTDSALLTATAIALMSATSCASRVTLRPFAPATEPAASRALMTTPRTANPALDVGGLGAHESCHGFDSGLVCLYRLEHRQDVRFTNFPTFIVSLAATTRECSTLVINVLIFLCFLPVDRRGCGFTGSLDPGDTPVRPAASSMDFNGESRKS